MQTTEQNQNSKDRVKNTFSTQSSKQDTDIDQQENFKNERQRYLQQRMNRRKQIQQIRKKQFGQSSSQSEQSVQKQKPQPKIVKDFQMMKPKVQPVAQNRSQSPKDEQQFRKKHQAYIQQKLNRKKELIQQRKKEFGSSSSDSDEQLALNKLQKLKVGNLQEQRSQTSEKSASVHVQKQTLQVKQLKSSQSKKSMGSSNGQQSSPVVLPQIIYKGQPIQSKKLTILIQSKKNLQWIQQTLIIENKRIKFINQNLQLMMAYISKIKMFFSSVNSSHREYLKLKVTYKNQDYFFACSNKRTIDNVSEYYFVFSRIIQDKLVQIGFEPKKNEATIFPNYMNLKDAPQNLRTSAVVYGNILKKSQVLGNWQTRFIYITDKEIGSSKKPNDKPSMIIPASTITQLWTRFDIQSNNMLSIKIMYNSGTKTEFGIPLSNFTDEFNWLYSFFKIIKPRD